MLNLGLLPTQNLPRSFGMRESVGGQLLIEKGESGRSWTVTSQVYPSVCLNRQPPQGPKRPVYRLVGWEQVSGVGQAPISASLVILNVNSLLCLQVAFRKTARWPSVDQG